VEAAKTESHHFVYSVLQLAHDLREKEELVEEVRKRKVKGREISRHTDVVALMMLLNLHVVEPLFRWY
jgi:hypothetical protein